MLNEIQKSHLIGLMLGDRYMIIKNNITTKFSVHGFEKDDVEFLQKLFNNIMIRKAKWRLV